MSRPDFAFSFPFRVRYGECDPQGVVFNSRYLEYADLVYTEFCRSRGVDLSAADMPQLHLRHAQVSYVKPMRFDDEIDGFMRVSKLGNSSITKQVELHSRAREHLLAAMELVYVHVDLATGSSVPLTAHLRQTFREG